MIEVNYVGPLDAKIYLVGEAPGEQEVIKGEPFCGGAGRILNALLMSAGIHRAVRQAKKAADVPVHEVPNPMVMHTLATEPQKKRGHHSLFLPLPVIPSPLSIMSDVPFSFPFSFP